METATIFAVLFGVAVCVIVFLAIREIMTWYWKIDTILKYQHEQSELLKQILYEVRKQNQRIPTGTEIDLTENV